MRSIVLEAAEKFRAPDADKGFLIRRFEDTRLPEAARLLAQVAATDSEEDYVRAEALRALSYWDYQDRELLQEAGACVLRTAMSSMDDLVRTHATMALGRYIECPGLLDFLSQMVLDPSQDQDLRHNALESLRPNIRIPSAREALQRAAELGDSVGRAAKRYLGD